MPLPSDITSAPARVVEDEFGYMMVLTADGLAATFKDGRWQPGLLFGSLSLMNDFWQITDQHKKDLILSASGDALREFKRMDAERSSKESEQSGSDDSPIPRNYHITVFDNFHHGECWLGGNCSTAEEAIAYVRETVDRDLKRFWSELWKDRSKIRAQPTLDDLISYYKTFAETPGAFDDKGRKIFDTIAYMKERAVEIIGDTPSDPAESMIRKSVKRFFGKIMRNQRTKAR
jgi:hypothetical protein